MKTAHLTPIPGIVGAITELGRIFAKAAPKLPPSPKPKQRDEKLQSFPWFVQRDFSDDSVEVVIEITSYTSPGDNGSLDHRDPNYEQGYVDFGSAYYLDGRECVLTELEREAAERAFWGD
jgi:hypothetical protein